MGKPLKSIEVLTGILLVLAAKVSFAACPNQVCVAASASYTDVNNAVTSASNGDTVQIPGGSATWSSTLNVGAKAISIIGAGSSNTIITNNVGTLIEFARTGTTSLVRLSGIRINSSWTHEPVISLVGPISKVRIDNCMFDKAATAIISNYVSKNADGPVYGVVDHCQFINMGSHGAYFAVDIRRGESSQAPHFGQTSWQEWQANPNLPGSDRMLYFEDCTFTYNSAMSGLASGCDATFYGQYGGRACIRYSTFTGYALNYFDAHGDNPEWSTLFYEVYNNTFTSGPYTSGNGASQGKLVYDRGGMHIIHDNVFNGGKLPVALEVYWTGDVHTINNTYIWGNTRDGDNNQSNVVAITDSGQTPPGFSAAHIILNQNYFLHAPQSGQTFYPYTPLAHPHPLITGGGPAPTATPAGGGPTPTATPTGGGPTPTPPGPTPAQTPTPAPLGVSFEATAGVITNPFVINSNAISQQTETDDPTQGGRALYTFSVPTSGDYQLSAVVDCANGGSNSFFVNIDAEPSSAMIWSIPLTSGPENRIATWYPSTTPKVWTLNAGTHQLIIRGREANTVLQHITLGIAPNAPAGLHVVP